MNGRATRALPSEGRMDLAPAGIVPIPATQRKAAFLDLDGTLVRELAADGDLEHMQLLPGVLEGLTQLRQRGFSLFVVSNQPGIGQGLIDEEQLDSVWQKLTHLLEPAGLRLDGFYYCPHPVERSGQPLCSCHKPRPGLLWRAAVEHNLDLHYSWMIGDMLHDVEAGHGAGCRSALVDNGGESEWRYGPLRVPDVIAHDFLGAVRLLEDRRILAKARRNRYGALV